MSSCNRVKTTDDNSANSITTSNSSTVEVSQDNKNCDTGEQSWGDMTQAEINDECVKAVSDYENLVESGFQEMISLLPKYKESFNIEKKKYEQYLNAVLVVAGFGDHGSSSPCYFSDVRNQSVELRHESYENFLLYLQGIDVSFPETQFTDTMIDQAYQSFIASVYKDADLFWGYEESELEDYKSDLKKEQKCWNEWMSYRNFVSSKLPKDLRIKYDGCTNLIKRIKLRQVKNQNQALGVTGHEPLDCILPENCSDKDLLEYPGFDKIWAKHLKDLDWVPTFEK